MPYGMPKSIGGDTPESDAWMEKCVGDVKATGKSESSAIAICKSEWMNKKMGGGKRRGVKA